MVKKIKTEKKMKMDLNKLPSNGIRFDFGSYDVHVRKDWNGGVRISVYGGYGIEPITVSVNDITGVRNYEKGIDLQTVEVKEE